MTPLAGLNHSHSTASGGARAARRATWAGGSSRTAVKSPMKGAYAALSRRRGSAMGAYRTRTDPAADRQRRTVHRGEPWNSLTTSPT